MTVVVLGVDALDPDLVAEGTYPNLTLDAHAPIDSINSTATDEPSTHELWPTIITGLRPEEHGLQLDAGIEWENPLLNIASDIAATILPNTLRSQLGAWLLQNTDEAAFRTPSTYYQEQGMTTVFDNYSSVAIGVPNYVVDPDTEDREHQLRRNLGELFRHDPTREDDHKHTSSDPGEFYHLCLEMSMIRIARVRRALRRREYELVFGYTSGLDLVGHITYENPKLQTDAYEELDEFIGELWDDIDNNDELVLISDHGLQDGIHTDEAMIASTSKDIVEDVDSLLDFRSAIERQLGDGSHRPQSESITSEGTGEAEEVRQHLEDLGYM